MVDAKQGPNERRALAYLDGFLPHDFLSDDERRLIRLAKLAVARARFASLQRDLNALQRNAKPGKFTPAAIADKLIQLLQGYPLQEMENQGAASPENLPPVEATPEIILSESFDHPPSA